MDNTISSGGKLPALYRKAAPSSAVAQEGPATAVDQAHLGSVSGPTDKGLKGLKAAFANEKWEKGVVSSGLGIISAGVAVAGMGAVLGGFGGTFGVAGAVMGAVVGSMFGAGSSEKVTPSGVVARHTHGGLFSPDATSNYTLPTGTTISVVVNEQGKTLKARDREGQELNVDHRVDPKSQHQMVRVTGADGVVTELNCSNLDFTVMSPRQRQATSDGVSDFRELKQLVRADGSTEMIVGERSRAITQEIPDPLHHGETIQQTVPHSHSFYQVNVSPQGDSEVSFHNRNFGVAEKKDGVLYSTNRPERVDGVRFTTSLDVRGDKFSVYKQAGTTSAVRAAMGAMFGGTGAALEMAEVAQVSPFVSIQQMRSARESALAERLSTATSFFQEPQHHVSPTGEHWVLDKKGRLAVQSERGEVVTRTLEGFKGQPTFDEKGRAYLITEDNGLLRVDSRGISKDLGGFKGQLGEPAFNSEGKLQVSETLGQHTILHTLDPQTGVSLGKELVRRNPL